MRQSSVPQWRSLGITTVRYGPWRPIVLVWLCGGIAALIWLVDRPFRTSVTVDPWIAGVVGGSLGGMVAVRTYARFWHDASAVGRWLFAAVSMVVGAALMSLLSERVLRPVVTRTLCGLAAVTGQSSAASAVGWLLPLATLIAWMYYVVTDFPVFSSQEQLTDTALKSRYAHALGRRLPIRLVLSLLAAGAAVAGYRRVAPVETSDPAHIAEQLQNPVTAIIDFESGGVLRSRLRAASLREQQRALARLAELELDAARPNVTRAMCWLVSGEKADERVLRASEGFAALDSEIDEWASSWKPSATAAYAIVDLMPLTPNSARAPLFPDLWAPHAVSRRPVTSTQVASRDFTYRNEVVMRVRRTTGVIDGKRLLISTSIGFPGRGMLGQELVNRISNRLASRPTRGPCPYGGSFCAEWRTGLWLIRVAPEGNSDSATSDTPMWLTLSRPEWAGGYCCG